MLVEHWPKLITALKEKIDIVGEVDIINIVADPFKVLVELEKYVDFKFKPNQRLVISQLDNLFYTKQSPYSITFYNLFVIVSHLGLPTEHLLIMSNQNIQQEVEILSKIFNVTPMKVFTSLYNIMQTVDPIELTNFPISPESITHSFINLNGLKRSSRILLICDLKRRSLIDKGIVTWNFSKLNEYSIVSPILNTNNTNLPLLVSSNNSIVNDLLLLNDEYKELFNQYAAEISASSKSHPLVSTFEKVNSSKQFQPKFIQNALIYLVTETVADYPYAYLSEKTFKGFLVKRPMLVFGAQHVISRIKELGFKTWDNFWDESYDSLPNVSDRVKAICNIVEDMSKLNVTQLQDICIKMQDVLEYNYNWYVNEFANKQLNQLVQESNV